MALTITLGLLIMRISAVMLECTVSADDGAPQLELRHTIETLIQQLDSQILAERARAERALLELGPEVLTYLPAPELPPGAAVRESIKRIRIQLERRAARESAQASQVRFSGDVTVAAILKELTAQTRNRIELGPDARSFANQSLRVDFENRPFWECLDDICERLKLCSVFDAQHGVLHLRPRSLKDQAELSVQRTGPFRLAIQSAEIRPIVGNPSSRLLRISGKVGLEPRLRPLFLHFAAADIAAIGKDGRRLESWNLAATYELPVADAGREVPVQFDYLLPPGEDQASVTIRGRLTVQLAAGTERIVFDQTAQTAGVARRRGGVTVRLREVKFEPGEMLRSEIKVTVGYDAGGPAFESHRTWMFHNAVYLENETGRRVNFTEYDTSLQTNGTVGVDYRWEQLVGPATQYRFVYEAPTLILDLPLEVNLDAIPTKTVNSPAPRNQ